MFKKLFVISMLFLFSSITFASDTLTTVTPFYTEQVPVSSVIPNKDTIGGTSDSFQVFKKSAIARGWTYILTIPTITGTGSDSVKYQIRTRAFDENGSVIMGTLYDTVIVATGKYVILPINTKKLIGRMFDCMLFLITGNGGQQILDGLWCDRLRQ